VAATSIAQAWNQPAVTVVNVAIMLIAAGESLCELKNPLPS